MLLRKFRSGFTLGFGAGLLLVLGAFFPLVMVLPAAIAFLFMAFITSIRPPGAVECVCLLCDFVGWCGLLVFLLCVCLWFAVLCVVFVIGVGVAVFSGDSL